MSIHASNHGDEDRLWANEWLAGVADGSSTMSQRKLTSVEKHGGISVAKDVAQRLGVHLLRLRDDKGNELIAASRHPFDVVC